MVQQVCRLIEVSNGEAVTLDALSEQVGVSSFHLQRTFKSIMGMSPNEYAETRRLTKFKQSVRAGEKITDAIYDAGFGSSSRLYELASSELGMTPATYGKGGRGAVIRYALGDSPLGRLLVAATEKGVCSVRLGDSDDELTSELRREFFAAEIVLDESRLRPALAAVVDHLNDKISAHRLASRHSRHRISTPGLGTTSKDSRRGNVFIHRRRKRHRSGKSCSRRRARLRQQSGGAGHSLSSCDS